MSLQITVDDIKEHLMSFSPLTSRTSQKLAFLDSTNFVTLSSSSSLQSTLDHVQYMKNKITLQDQHQLRCPNNIAQLLKKIIVIKHVVVVNKRIQQNISLLKLKFFFSKNISSVELKSYKRSDYNINTVDESPNKSSFSFHCAATRSYKYRGVHLLSRLPQQGPLFTSVKQRETVTSTLIPFFKSLFVDVVKVTLPC